MPTRVLYLSGRPGLPGPLEAFAERSDSQVTRCERADDVETVLNRGAVDLLIVDADDDFGPAVDLCRRLKEDPFHSVIPIVFVCGAHRMQEVEAAFEGGADEVLTPGAAPDEQLLRLRNVLRRAARDVAVHPTTMLPGTKIIELEIQRRIQSGEKFAVCYADIDSFKEFNDKYSYHRGDRVIWILSRILRDIVRRLSKRGFVGHIGGDDFIYALPLGDLHPVSQAVVETFDTLMPLQYSEEDQRLGHFLAEDRQGRVREIPLMSVSIGIVTNERRLFTHPARVGELAAEMKHFAKSKPGSLYAIDRRHDAS